MAVKFSEKAEQVLLNAGDEAKTRSHDFVGTEHLLHGILLQLDSVAVQAIAHCNVSAEDLNRAVQEALERLPLKPQSNNIPFTPHAKRCIELAGDEAIRWGHFYITTEHLLLGLLV